MSVMSGASGGINLDHVERMTFPELVTWWGHARDLIEGPPEGTGHESDTDD